MKALVDTHALFWALIQDKKKLTSKALQVIDEAEMLLLPTIVLLELLGLLEKKQKLRYFDKLLNNLSDSKYVVIPLDITVLKETRSLKDKLELHDRVIVATAKSLNLPIITKDEEITKLYKKIVW